MPDSGIGTPYWYEWNVGILKCLEMLSDPSIESVVFQAPDFQSLDDVVVYYNDTSSVNIQVKHTDINDTFTYSTLTSDNTSMLNKWGTEWKKCKDSYKIREIQIVTNRRWGENKDNQKKRCSFAHFIQNIYPQLKEDFNYISSCEYDNNAIVWLKKQLAFLSDDAESFIKILTFQQESNLYELEIKIQKALIDILGTTKEEILNQCLNNLFSQLRIWATSRREQPKVYREDVYQALCVPSKFPVTYELYPQKPIFPSRKRFASLLMDNIKNSSKKMFLLKGLPGAGKTNFVSYLAQLENSIVDFRFYTYLPVNKDYPTFSDDAGYYSGEFFLYCLLLQLKKKFEEMRLLNELKFPLIYGHLTVSEMREIALKFLPIYSAKIGKPCYFFIDGLDHAARSNDAKNSFLYQLPMPNDIGENIKFVLVTQPLNGCYPTWLDNNSDIEYINIPQLEEDDITLLLQNEGIEIPCVDNITLSQSIIEVVGSNALNVLFAVMEVKAYLPLSSFEDLIDNLKTRCLSGHIHRYYEWIINSLDRSLLLSKIELIFAFTSQKIKANDISIMCGCDLDNTVDVLDQLYPLILKESDGYYSFHNDIRLYLKNTILLNRNFDTLSHSIGEKIMNNEQLSKYKYDILFEIFNESKDKKFLYELFSPEYIIKSLQYDIPAYKIFRQFYQVANTVAENVELDYLFNVSLAASTIAQYINCIEWNEKQYILSESKVREEKTTSEKYVLSIEKELKTVVSDIYTLLINHQHERAAYLFSEYLLDVKLQDFLTYEEEVSYFSEQSFYEKSGYVCRYFAPDIFDNDYDCNNDRYLLFFKGWIRASQKFNSPKEIQKTFKFRYYDAKALFEYIVKLCEKNVLDTEGFETLENIIFNWDEVPIGVLIEVCTNSIFTNRYNNDLIALIHNRQYQLLTDSVFSYDSERIVYFIMSCFCLYQNMINEQERAQLYNNILLKCRISEEKRGYKPARDLYDFAKIVFQSFYSNNNNDIMENIIYSLAYLSNKYGTGSCHDCESYKIKKFLFKVISQSYLKENDCTKTQDLCNRLVYLYTGKMAIYSNELAPLFAISGSKKEFLEIVDYWVGLEGVLWNQSYSEVEYHCKNIISILEGFKLFELAQEVKARQLFKIFGYVGHKDYSLLGLLEHYKALPLSEGKLLEYGMYLLTVSNAASEIGDNRISSMIDREIFVTAVDLGVKYVDALFEFKNTPDHFYYWRKCLIEVYYEKIQELDMNDEELRSLYLLINAWINSTIESFRKRDFGYLTYLKNFNYKIISLFKEPGIKSFYENMGNYVAPDDPDYEAYLRGNNNNKVIDVVQREGYNEITEKIIINTYEDTTYSHVSLLISIGDIIPPEVRNTYISNCIIPYITKKRFDFHSSGIDQLIEHYYKNISDADWLMIFKNIIEVNSQDNSENFYCISNDLEILSLYYNRKNFQDKLEDTFMQKINMHWLWLTACGILKKTKYQLHIDQSINTLTDFKIKQIG